MKDETLVCQDCGNEFIWTVGEQKFYEQKEIDEPRYCLICRGKYRAKEEFERKHTIDKK